MKGLQLFAMLWAFHGLATAATITPVVEELALGAAISNIDLPVTLDKDLASGFENKLLIRVSLLSQAAAIAQADAAIIVKFDLWDERFTVRRLIGGRPPEELVFKDVQEVVKHLRSLTLERLFQASIVPPDRTLTLQAELLINPIEREKIERLRKWVAENSAPRDAVGGGTFTPRPNELFNRIFDQYTRGAEVAAAWRITVTSQSFDWPRAVGGQRDR